MTINGPTEQEEDILLKTVELWNLLRELPTDNPTEKEDLQHHIHAIQDVIAARCVHRHYKRSANDHR
jgi:hypothetical protein